MPFSPSGSPKDFIVLLSEAVKFTDKKTIDVKQQQLVSAIKFSWSMDPDNKGTCLNFK